MSMPLRPGERTRLGSYELDGRLGEGGMGTVYLAHDTSGRKVAVKVVRPEFSQDAEFRGRFRSEVNRAKQVPPFSTAEVLDADPDHDPPYLVVEYVDGPDLATVIREKGPLTGSALHGVAVGIATALTAIHSAGVIHRDLKPGNVLVAMGGIKVIDFGIARAFEATSQHTRTDQLVGTVAYMAPERFESERGHHLTTAADIFSWGAVVAYAATGHTPFAAGSAPATAMRILTQEPDLSGLPTDLHAIVQRSLAKDPADRPAARELLDALLVGDGPRAAGPVIATVREPLAPAAPGGAPAPPSPPAGRRRRVRTAVTLAGLLAVALFGLAKLALGTGSPIPSSPDAVTVSGSVPIASQVDTSAAILQGARRTLIHIADIDRDLALEDTSSEVKVSDGTGAKSQFALVPTGEDYLIRSLHAGDKAQDRKICLGVKAVPDDAAVLVAEACTATRATVFSLRPTGGRDDKGRPTYHLHNDEYGFVLWEPTIRSLVVGESAGRTPKVRVSFVDRGAL